MDVAGVFELNLLQIFFALNCSRCYGRIILQSKLSSRPTGKDVAKCDEDPLINRIRVLDEKDVAGYEQLRVKKICKKFSAKTLATSMSAR